MLGFLTVQDKRRNSDMDQQACGIEKLVKNSEAGLELILPGAFKCRGVTVTCHANLCAGIRKGTIL